MDHSRVRVITISRSYPSWIELTIAAEGEEQSRFELSHIVYGRGNPR